MKFILIVFVVLAVLAWGAARSDDMEARRKAALSREKNKLGNG